MLDQPIIIMFLDVVGVCPALILARFVIWKCIMGCLSHLHGIYYYIHIFDGLAFSLLVVVSGQPICKENLRPRFVYVLDPVLMNFKRMHCMHCDSVATSFLNMATNGLWLVMMRTSLAKQ